jgi:uncharacterized membrane protein YkvA (DUF1232 family)
VQEEPIVVDLSARERRFYERVRSRWIAPTPGRGSGVADMVLLLPDLVVLMLRLLRDPRVPLSAKAFVLGGVGYILSPVDLMPEFLLGPLGFVDDILVVAAALSRLVNDVHPDVVRAHWPGQGDALEAVKMVTEWAENTVTKRLPRFVRRLIQPER